MFLLIINLWEIQFLILDFKVFIIMKENLIKFRNGTSSGALFMKALTFIKEKDG